MEMHEAKCPAIDYICNEKKDKKLPKMRLVYSSKSNNIHYTYCCLMGLISMHYCQNIKLRTHCISWLQGTENSITN